MPVVGTLRLNPTRRTRYNGYCLDCRTETAFPEAKMMSDIGDWNGNWNTRIPSILWVCFVCGLRMHWYISRTGMLEHPTHRVVIWTVVVPINQHLDPEDIIYREMTGDWYQECRYERRGWDFGPVCLLPEGLRVEDLPEYRY
jgi:hypothetical protein